MIVAASESMNALRPPRRPETVPLGRAALARRGWTAFEAGAPERDSFQPLLEEVRRARGAHSWRWMARAGGLSELLRRESRLRPSVVYAYYARRRDGNRELVAAAAVAAKVSRAYPHPGWPVVARGFVRPRHRGAGLYAALLAHRVRVCRRIWGARLEAIHLGSANPRVWRAALSGAGGMRFVPIGRELLGTGRTRLPVRAFAAFTPAFSARLRAEARGEKSLETLTRRLLAGRFRPADHARLARALDAARGRRPALGRLRDLFAAIPLSG